MKTVVVIPCRWGSSRLPGKPLLPLLKKPFIQHVYERATCSKEAFRIVVATDDPRIEKTVRAFGGEVFLTGQGARTGSDRVAELIETVRADAYLNLQGDELILNPLILDELIVAFSGVQPFEIGTLKQEITDPKELTNPNVVKVVTDAQGLALYFSRSPIPYHREDKRIPKRPISNTALRHRMVYKHLGIYIFEREALKSFSSRPIGMLEALEKLEQLRALEMGLRIRVWETRHESIRVDTRTDLRHAEKVLLKGCDGR